MDASSADPVAADSEPHDPHVSHDQTHDAEQKHFERIVNSFKFYSRHHQQKLLKTINYCDGLPAEQRQRLNAYSRHMDSLRTAVRANARIMHEMVRDSECMFENRDHCEVPEPGVGDNDWGQGTEPRAADMDKTACVLRQIVREWTRDGIQERSQSFGQVIEAVDRYFGSRDAAVKREIRILVPGAGLGRLPNEIAKRGYATQGNEFSMFMLITSHFILNKCKEVDAFTFYPYVHQMSNVLHSSHQVRPVTFPDEDPSDISPHVPFSMTAGNFIDVYSAPEYESHFHCITSCFFIDTAHNVLQYIETMHKSLRDNGIWINLGPFLYHFSDIADEDSIEPCYEFVRDIIISYGFQFLEERHDVPCFYTQNSDSMLSYVYKCVFFVVRKTGSNSRPTDS